MPVSPKYERENLEALRLTDDERDFLVYQIELRRLNGERWTELPPHYCFRRRCLEHNSSFKPGRYWGDFDIGHDAPRETAPAVIHIFVWPQEPRGFELLARTIQDEYLHFWLDCNEGRVSHRTLDNVHSRIDLDP